MLEEFWNRVLQSLSPEPPTPPNDADQLLRDFLRGNDPAGYVGGAYARPVSEYNQHARLVLSGGGYDLLFRIAGEKNVTYLLNLDHPLAPLPVPDWRERALRLAADVGVELLPVSELAYRRVAVDNQAPRIVHRRGFEAVFTIADQDTTKYYLSGYDEQETPPLYFLCRLPNPVATVDEARESLKPESIQIALESGAAVRRQGDLFFISTDLDDADVRTATNNIVIGGADAIKRMLYGTAHYADSVAHLPSGVMLAKGTVHHWPRLVGQHRDPDHSDLVLPDGWWMVARNTVPATHGRAPVDQSFAGMPPWLEAIWQSMTEAFSMPAVTLSTYFPTTSEGG